MSLKENAIKLKQFINNYCDKRNYAIYAKLAVGKNVCRVRVKDKIIEDQGFISPKLYQFEEHLKSEVYRLGYTNKSGNPVWLIMLDFDTDKTDPNRHKALQEAVDITRKILGINFHVEHSTFSDDLHGYIKISKPDKHNSLFLIETIKKAVANIGKLCPIKKLEVMGFPAVYRYDNGKISEVVYSGLIAKVPRSANLTGLIEQPSIPFRVIFDLATSEASVAEAAGAAVLVNHGNSSVNQGVNSAPITGREEDAILGGTSFLKEKEQQFNVLWNLMCSEDSKLFEPKRRITKTEFIKLCSAWMSVVLTADKEVPDRPDELRGTAATAEVSRRAQISCIKRRKWVEQTLVRLGVLMLRNGETEEGISRRWAWSWNNLREALKQTSILWVDKVPEKPNRWKSSKEML